MRRPIYQVDAFTDTAFEGNPAAVCLLATDRSDTWKQDVAAEMNLSETAFLHPQSDETFQLQWFTPTHEVSLCGHATLASAHVLWEDGIRSVDAPIRFNTKGGTLTATRDEEWITLTFPSEPPTEIDSPSALRTGLNERTCTYTGWTGRDHFVQLPSAEAVRSLSPDMEALASLEGRGVIVTAPADIDEADFVSRFFAPGVGVPEDPVTGSAHCALGPYWADRLGQGTLTGRQVSSRGGTVRTQLDAPDADRIGLQGRATTVFQGRMEA